MLMGTVSWASDQLQFRLCVKIIGIVHHEWNSKQMSFLSPHTKFQHREHSNAFLMRANDYYAANLLGVNTQLYAQSFPSNRNTACLLLLLMKNKTFATNKTFEMIAKAIHFDECALLLILEPLTRRHYHSEICIGGDWRPHAKNERHGDTVNPPSLLLVTTTQEDVRLHLQRRKTPWLVLYRPCRWTQDICREQESERGDRARPHRRARVFSVGRGSLRNFQKTVIAWWNRCRPTTRKTKCWVGWRSRQRQTQNEQSVGWRKKNWVLFKGDHSHLLWRLLERRQQHLGRVSPLSHHD